MFLRIIIILSLLVLLGEVAAQPGRLPNFQQSSGGSRDTTKTKRSGKGSIFLNDTLKQIYGPKTTLWTTEEDLFYNRKKYRPLDTSINNLHRWTYVQKLNYQAQDLGNVGTALNPLYPTVRTFAGATTGFNSFRHYFEVSEPVYYDTKSPFARINVIWGGSGRSLTHIEFARNINPRWNFGFNYRPILVDKQLQRQKRGDRQIIAHYYDFFMTYKSKNEKYFALFNFRRTKHRVFESGGVYVTDPKDINQYFDKQASPVLTSTESSQLIRSLHFFNQYSINKSFQGYGAIDFAREVNGFTNDYTKENQTHTKSLYDHWERVKKDTLNIIDWQRFITFQSELGLKGRAKFLFYNVYYKLRGYSLTFNHDNSRIKTSYTSVDGSGISQQVNTQNLFSTPVSFNNTGTEHYVGGRVALDIDSLTRLSGVAEINQRGNYSIDAKFASRLLDASFTQSISRPSFLYNQFRGSHDYWNNSFNNITGLKLEGFLKTPFKRFLIAPGLTYTLLSNYVYFKKDNYGQQQTVLPVQTASVITFANPQVKLGISVTKKIKLSGHVINNLIISDKTGAMKIPDWLVKGQIALEDYWFTKHLQVQVGVDVTWRSAYYAMGYDIPIQQYYVQNDVKVGDAFIADVFLNARLLRGRLFFKYHNIAQLFTKTGYFMTPGYPGQRNILDFGFEMILFD